jgi:hypothetical protein
MRGCDASCLFYGGLLLLPEDYAARRVEAGPLVQPEEVRLATVEY